VCAAEGFCPSELARVTLHFEILVAFGAAKAEEFCVVADEGYTFRWVAGLRAEVAGFDSIVLLVWILGELENGSICLMITVVRQAATLIV
jgi:hypothetical protein